MPWRSGGNWNSARRLAARMYGASGARKPPSAPLHIRADASTVESRSPAKIARMIAEPVILITSVGTSVLCVTLVSLQTPGPILAIEMLLISTSRFY